MAIQFARIEIVGRSSGSNACCKGAYNARTKVQDQQTNVVYNFSRHGDGVFHEIFLPLHANEKFYKVSEFMNLVERSEKRKDSQLLKDIVLALPDDKELNLDDRIEITKRLIAKRGWIKEGLGVQVDIHQPHDGEKNWHAHLLVTTRRFKSDGLSLGPKATDLNPEFKKAGNRSYVVPEAEQIHEELRDIINDYFKELGLENRVDLINVIPGEHIGPVRMRSILNEVVIRNEQRNIANIEALYDYGSVLTRVTKGASIFSKKDLERAVKCIPDQVTANDLVVEVLSSDKVLPLYHEGGTAAELYTTKSIRGEELKLLRLSGYINKQKNIVAAITNSSKNSASISDTIVSKINSAIKEDTSLNSQQREAISHLLLGDGGFRVLKGRAGTGKSHVLGKVAQIAQSYGVNIIGLAPTHKAKTELVDKGGFSSCDTVKGFLFKLYNGKTYLPKGSLVVIDEATMVGNNDYSEILRVAAARSCNVILAGDERQLSSIARGGMFECFADKFGYCEMNDVRRQELQWCRDVSISFAEGDAKRSIGILHNNNRLYSSGTKIESMEMLFNDWNKSKYAVVEKLIIAIKNSDVDALNAGAREFMKNSLKAKGLAIGPEIVITKDGQNYCFIKHDRIVFNTSNKDLKVNNGDFGTLESVSENKFVVKLDKGVWLEFNPQEFSGFKHGYASTVYKAQGSSIKDVYILFDGFSTIQSSYVAMSRHIEDLHFYINKVATKTINCLIWQLSFNPELGVSINYYTKDELFAKNTLENKGLLSRSYDKVSSKIKEHITSFVDKSIADRDYYVFEKPEVIQAEVEELLELVHIYNSSSSVATANMAIKDNAAEDTLNLEEKAVVGGYAVNSNSVILPLESHVHNAFVQPKMTPKERFYANREYKLRREQAIEQKNEGQEQENQKLRQEVKWSSEKVALDLLGEPNKRLSNRSTLRFGSKGSLAVKISGEKCGTWYDFEAAKGGDLFDLVQDVKNCDFKDAANYLRSVLGISSLKNLNSNIAYLHTLHDKYVGYHKEAAQEKAEEAAKLKKVENLYARSKVISRNSVAARYLTNTRGIELEYYRRNTTLEEKPGDVAISSNGFSDDIRTCSIYEESLGKRLQAIVAFARNNSGEITGGQQLLLDSKTLNKADVPSARKSFSKIAGSFVAISNQNNQVDYTNNITIPNNITIIAEGLETALSIHQAGLGARVICSLGVSNIKNYVPKEGEMLIIAADNDGPNSVTNKTIDEASNVLSQHCPVRIVRPKELGDFNDILQSHSNIAGTAIIRDTLVPVLGSLTAKTLDEFLENEHLHNDSYKQITDHDKAKLQEDIAYIRKYDIAEEKILASFKHDYDKGFEVLEITTEKVVHLEKVLHGLGRHIIEEARAWGSNLDDRQLINKLMSVDQGSYVDYLEEHRNDVLNDYLNNNLGKFQRDRTYAKSIPTVLNVVEKEQEFLSEIADSMGDNPHQYKVNNSSYLKAISAIKDTPELLEEVKRMSEQAISEGALYEVEVLYLFQTEPNMGKVYSTIDAAFEKHHIKNNLATFKQGKYEAKTSEDFLKAALTEQEFLVSLNDNLKYPILDSKLQSSISEAIIIQNEGLIDKLQMVVGHTIDAGIKTDEVLLEELQSATSLKLTYVRLDMDVEKYNIERALGLCKNSKMCAKSHEELLSVISKEQNFLAELQDTLKYPEQYEQNLKDMINQAYTHKQECLIPLLQKSIVDSIEIGTRAPATMLEELRDMQDIKSTYINLDKELENHHIKSNIAALHQEKQQAGNLPEILEITAKEQEFLASLHGNLKYPKQYSKTLLNSIDDAHIWQIQSQQKYDHEQHLQIRHDNVLQELYNVTNHITKHQIMSEQSLLTHLKADKKVHEVTKELNKVAVVHYNNVVNDNLNHLIKHKHLEFNGHVFDCPIKYLQHEIENPAHEYADITRFQKAIPKVEQVLHQMELKKEMQYSIGGLSM